MPRRRWMVFCPWSDDRLRRAFVCSPARTSLSCLIRKRPAAHEELQGSTDRFSDAQGLGTSRGTIPNVPIASHEDGRWEYVTLGTGVQQRRWQGPRIFTTGPGSTWNDIARLARRRGKLFRVNTRRRDTTPSR